MHSERALITPGPRPALSYLNVFVPLARSLQLRSVCFRYEIRRRRRGIRFHRDPHRVFLILLPSLSDSLRSFLLAHADLPQYHDLDEDTSLAGRTSNFVM